MAQTTDRAKTRKMGEMKAGCRHTKRDCIVHEKFIEWKPKCVCVRVRLRVCSIQVMFSNVQLVFMPMLVHTVVPSFLLQHFVSVFFLYSFLSKYTTFENTRTRTNEDTLQIVGINIKFFEWNQKWSSFAVAAAAAAAARRTTAIKKADDKWFHWILVENLSRTPTVTNPNSFGVFSADFRLDSIEIQSEKTSNSLS